MTYSCPGCNKSLIEITLLHDELVTLCPTINCTGERKSFSNTLGDQMAEKQKQRFGQLTQNYGSFGELRRQKKEPHTEVLYIHVENDRKDRMSLTNLQSINNTPTPMIEDYMRRVGTGLSEHALLQEHAEKILDMCYAELNKRLQAQDVGKLAQKTSKEGS